VKFGTETDHKHVYMLHIKYCDITPESRNSPLLDNGSLSHVSMEMRIHEDRLGTEPAFHINEINKQFPRIRASNIFQGYVLDYKSGMQRRLIQQYGSRHSALID
jgi:hypothetical protein